MLGRVAGYSGFDSYAVVGISELKPGQKSLKRDYYKDVNNIKAEGKTYLSTYSRFGSNHQGTVDNAVKPSDYKRVSRGGKQNLKYEYLHNPDLYQYTTAGKTMNQFNPRASSQLTRAASTNIAGSNANNNFGASQSKLYKTTKAIIGFCGISCRR